MEYKYNGYTFIPKRKLNKKEKEMNITELSLSLGLKRDNAMGMWNYDDRKVYYNHEEFYKAVNVEEDIFICKETNKCYIPCENELFICKNVAV